MALTGYRKDRPMVLGQHTPISLAREGGLWKRIPFLKDNDGMLPPYMVVVGDRRRVIAGAMPLSNHIMLQKEVTRCEMGSEAAMKAKINHIITQLTGIQHLAREAGLFFEPSHPSHICLKPAGPSDPLPASAAFLEAKDAVGRRWHMEISQLIAELAWLAGPAGKPEFFSSSRLSAAILSLAMDAAPANDSKSQVHEQIGRRLWSLVDYINADAGRVNLAIGVFEYQGKPLPLTILETQMGCPAQDINAWEALVNSREDGYMLGKTEVPGRGLVAIRAGTCGGIIVPDGKGGQLEEPHIEIGDVVNATYSFADGATVRQRMGAWSSLNQEDISSFRAAIGGRMTTDGEWPVVRSSPAVVEALYSSSTALGLKCHEGGNFTKESLYLESDEERVKDLRRKYGALSTEMEHFGLAHLTDELTKAGIPASNGLISTVVGTVPGGSFAMPGSKEEEKANESQGRMLEAAMRALWKIAYG